MQAVTRVIVGMGLIWSVPRGICVYSLENRFLEMMSVLLTFTWKTGEIWSQSET